MKDSALTRGIAIIAVVLFALYVLGTWEGIAPPREVAQVPPPFAPQPRAQATPQAAPKPTGLWGISLGDKFDKYAKSHGPFDKEQPPPGTVKKAAGDETYIQRNGQLRVGVRKGLVSSIAYGCKEKSDPTAMYKVACHAAPQRINAVFGEGVRVLCPKPRANDADKDMLPFVRAYDVIEYQTRYIVIKDAVTGFVVYPPGELETLVGINWDRCPAKGAAAR